MTTCALVGATYFNEKDFMARYNEGFFDFIIAVDGGFVPLDRLGVAPDMAIGDFDSLGYVPRAKRVSRHPVNKDASDMELALQRAANYRHTDIYVYGGIGGRLDHTLANLQLFASFSERGAYDKFFNRVIFPIMDVNSRVIGFGGRVMGEGEPKYLNSPETRLFDKSRNLFGLCYAKKSRKKYFILCEGYMDVISMHQAGFTNAVASLGTALTEEQCRLLRRYVGEILLTYDSDGAGIKAAKRAMPMLKAVGIQSKVISMKPYKDPDEFIKAMGQEAFQERIDQAQNSFLWLIDVMKLDFDL